MVKNLYFIEDLSELNIKQGNWCPPEIDMTSDNYDGEYSFVDDEYSYIEEIQGEYIGKSLLVKIDPNVNWYRYNFIRAIYQQIQPLSMDDGIDGWLAFIDDITDYSWLEEWKFKNIIFWHKPKQSDPLADPENEFKEYLQALVEALKTYADYYNEGIVINPKLPQQLKLIFNKADWQEYQHLLDHEDLIFLTSVS